MLQSQTPKNSSYKFNVATQSVASIGIEDTILNHLASLSHQRQWILFTANCPRPRFEQFVSNQINCSNIIQMKTSQTQSEVEIVIKAIKSGNASAIVASNNISNDERNRLIRLATQFQCAVFFVEGRSFQYH